MIIDLDRSIDLRWLLMSGAIFISDSLVYLWLLLIRFWGLGGSYQFYLLGLWLMLHTKSYGLNFGCPELYCEHWGEGGDKYRILPTFNFPLNSPLDQGTGGGGQAESCQFPNQSNHPSPTIQPSPSSQAPQTPSLESLHHQFDRFPMPPNFTHFYSYPIQTHNYNDVIRDYILTLCWTLIFDNIALNIVGSTLL